MPILLNILNGYFKNQYKVGEHHEMLTCAYSWVRKGESSACQLFYLFKFYEIFTNCALIVVTNLYIITSKLTSTWYIVFFSVFRHIISWNKVFCNHSLFPHILIFVCLPPILCFIAHLLSKHYFMCVEFSTFGQLCLDLLL